MPKISVIVPVYNTEKYLSRCIESVLGQTFTDYEVILVDDGSTDKSGVICDYYREKDRRILVVHRENKGVSSARNTALDIATGQFIYFLDSDDKIDEDLFERVLPNLENKYDMVCFQYMKHYEDGSEEKVVFGSGSFSLIDFEQKLEFVVDHLLFYKIGWEPWNRVYRKDIIDKYNIRFTEKIGFAEDLFFCLCYCLHSDSIIMMSDCLYHYYIHENSTMTSNAQTFKIDTMNELSKNVLRYLESFHEYSCFTKLYPIIHYLLLDIEFNRTNIEQIKSPKAIREYIYENVKDLNHLIKYYRAFLKDNKWFPPNMTALKYAEKRSLIKYIIDGNYVSLMVRNRYIYRFFKN